MNRSCKKFRITFIVQPLMFAGLFYGLSAGRPFPAKPFLQTRVNSFPSPVDTGISGATLEIDAPVLVDSTFAFTEGPAVDKNGNVYFTDQPNDKIWEYGIDGKLSVFMDHAGRSDGMYLDNSGNIISCADEHNELWSISPDKKVTVLARNFEGGIFNGPNDIWVNPVSSGMYFTDPYYPRNYWAKDHQHLSRENVYYLTKKGRKTRLAASGLNKPNGIIGSADGKTLYVADIGANKTYQYAIRKNGRLSNKQLFTNQGSDGMTIDNEGNIYLTGEGVTVYNSQGSFVEHIKIPEAWTANVCFGGRDMHLLFITASKSIYIVEMKVKGVQ